jgi:thioredoxin-related protein
MKRIILIAGFVCFAFLGGRAQEEVQLNWVKSFQQADSISKATNKPMLVFFSGSDWCKPCIKLKKYVLETEEFSKYSEKFVLYNADFPYRTKQDKALKDANEKLASQFNKDGQFPRVIFLSPQQKQLASLGFIDCTPKEYIAKIESLLKAQ